MLISNPTQTFKKALTGFILAILSRRKWIGSVRGTLASDVTSNAKLFENIELEMTLYRIHTSFKIANDKIDG